MRTQNLPKQFPFFSIDNSPHSLLKNYILLFGLLWFSFHFINCKLIEGKKQSLQSASSSLITENQSKFPSPFLKQRWEKSIAFLPFSVSTHFLRGNHQVNNIFESKIGNQRIQKKKNNQKVQMVQSINFDGIYYLAKLLRRPRFLLPHIYTENISKVNFRNLKESGIKGVIFDKDNTLTAPYIDEIHPLAKKGYEDAKSVFGSENLLILSNSAGTNDDLHHEDAKRVENRLGIHVLRHVHKKPSPKCLNEILEYYKEHLGQENIEANELLFVGDRILTDIAFGNLCGMATCFTKILTEEGDNRAAKYIRRIEVKAINKLLTKGWLPPVHRLFTYPDKLAPEKVVNKEELESYYYFAFQKYLVESE